MLIKDKNYLIFFYDIIILEVDLWKRNVLVRKHVSVDAKKVKNVLAKKRNVHVRTNNMRDKIIWILITIFVLVVVGVILMFTYKTKELESIKVMHFSYSSGYSAYSYTRYEIQKKDDGYYLDIKPYGVPEEEIQTVKVEKRTIKKILKVLNEYKVIKWDGFNKSNKYVLDGDSFPFNLITEDGINISASGYMRWPENYKEVRSELYEILNPLYEYKENRVYE